MIEESKNMESSLGNEIKYPELRRSNNSGISVFVERVHSVNGLHLISSVSQVFLGLCVVALSLTGAIQPLWISTIMTVAGSSTAVIGIYFMHSVFKSRDDFDSLLHKSIRRVIESQN